jgi:hypothetical protein
VENSVQSMDPVVRLLCALAPLRLQSAAIRSLGRLGLVMSRRRRNSLVRLIALPSLGTVLSL